MSRLTPAARHQPPARALEGARALPRALRWWVLVCMVSLLGFQSLGLVHRALHGGGVLPRVVLAVAQTSSAAPAAAAAASGANVTLAKVSGAEVTGAEATGPSQGATAPGGPAFGHAAGGSDCQLLDQLSTALGPIAQALAWTALLPDHPVATAQPHSAVVAQVWRAPARAPPRA